MWYLPVAGHLRRFFSNPKDTELMRWWDSDKRKKGAESSNIKLMLANGRSLMSSIISNFVRT
jgi:hypothetical protein